MILEAARFLAAFFVLGAHLSLAITTGANYPANFLAGIDGIFGAQAAVVFFFVLSGFVLYCAHAHQAGQWRQVPAFIIRRASRIYPLYWLSLLLAQLVWDLTQHVWAFVPPPYAQNFLLLPFHWYLQTIELNHNAWTLRYELSFYAGFMLLFVPRLGRWLLAGWFLATIWCVYWWLAPCQWLTRATGIYPGRLPDWLISHGVSVFTLLFFGGIVAGILFCWARPGRRTALCMLILASCLAGVEIWHDGCGAALPVASFTIPAALAYGFWIAAAAMAERAGILPRVTWFRYLGTLSYPLYILHPVVLLLFTFLITGHGAFVHRFPGAVWFVVLSLLSFVMSQLAVWLIERPVQSAVRRWS